MTGKKGSTHAKLVKIYFNGIMVDAKKCNKCGEIKPLDNFYFAPKGVGNRRPKCISCMAPTGRKITRLTQVEIHGENYDAKECKACMETLRLNMFNKGKGTGGHLAVCRVCNSKIARSKRNIVRKRQKLQRFVSKSSNGQITLSVEVNPLAWTMRLGLPKPISCTNVVSSNFLITTNDGFEALIPAKAQIQVVVDHSRYNQNTEWKNIEFLKLGDKVSIHNNRSENFNYWDGDGNFEQGWLLGEMLGDGGLPNESNDGYVSFWGSQRAYLASVAVRRVKAHLGARSDLTGTSNSILDKTIVMAAGLSELARHFGLSKIKCITPQIEMASSSFYCGFLRGLFDSDGSVQGDHNKGVSVRLNQSNVLLLQAVQRMLLRLGVFSVIYKNRRTSGLRELPDGKGGRKLYYCTDNHELVITKDNLYFFKKLIGFEDLEKARELENLITSYKRKMNRTRFVSKISSITLKEEKSFLIQSGKFDINGILVKR